MKKIFILAILFISINSIAQEHYSIIQTSLGVDGEYFDSFGMITVNDSMMIINSTQYSMHLNTDSKPIGVDTTLHADYYLGYTLSDNKIRTNYTIYKMYFDDDVDKIVYIVTNENYTFIFLTFKI